MKAQRGRKLGEKRSKLDGLKRTDGLLGLGLLLGDGQGRQCICNSLFINDDLLCGGWGRCYFCVCHVWVVRSFNVRANKKTLSIAEQCPLRDRS